MCGDFERSARRASGEEGREDAAVGLCPLRRWGCTGAGALVRETSRPRARSVRATSCGGRGVREGNREVPPRAGQGLLETTIAIGVIVTGLFAVFTLVLANTRASDAGTIRLGAVQLAREGVEVVRAIRDANWLAGRPWNLGMVGDGDDYTAVAAFDPVTAQWALRFGPNGIESDGARVGRTGGDGPQFLTQDVGGGTAGGGTRFRRLITVDPICMDRTMRTSGARCDPDRNAGIGIRVRSTVAWDASSGSRSVVVEEELYDWR